MASNFQDSSSDTIDLDVEMYTEWKGIAWLCSGKI